MILAGRERLVFLRLAQSLLPEERVTPDVLPRARAFLGNAQGIVRILFRVGLFLFEWGTFLFRTAGSIEHFCLLSPKGKTRYIRFWMHHRVASMRQLFLFLKTVVFTAFYDDAGRVRPC